MKKYFTTILMATVFFPCAKSKAGDSNVYYKYDAEGRVIEYSDASELYTSSYDSNGNEIRTKYYCFQGGCDYQNGDKPHSEQTYDKDGDLIAEKTYKYNYSTHKYTDNFSNYDYSNKYYTSIDPETGIRTKIYCRNTNCNSHSSGWDIERIYTYQTYEDGKDRLTGWDFYYNGTLSSKFVYAYEETEDGGMKRTASLYTCSGGSCSSTPDEEWVDQVKDKYGNFLLDRDSDRIYQYKYKNAYGEIESAKVLYCDEDYEDCLSQYSQSDWDNAYTITYSYDPMYAKKQWLEHRKLIYTLDEANAVAGKTNRVSIRYK